MADPTTAPPAARYLGFAGLLPQLLALAAAYSGVPEWRFAAQALGFAYAALILSFLGGLWWGLAAAAGARAPGWVYGAAVVPSLVALAGCVPWAIGATWPGPSMLMLGLALVASLAVDRRLAALDLAPAWWLRLRTPLSLGLGACTLGIAIYA
ncbi:DUF3429 domain-containing protein [Sphingomonas baiyangensis]|uniref:DUF3429 domain-containing protein n=1 Tax=Sphingomonas baiyangensis TaxID=2572576 RepID=A0A4U1L0S0_9SPHN|nr:DUF3429 domain-containing protein [Sphingomonas baiyangensis]TKD50357.1 DUF3429 domain-containing protein [Sphingomonas baiyangensis]